MPLTLFRGLSPASIDSWLDAARELTLEPGEVLFREGEEGADFFLILEGELRVSRDPDDHLLATLFAGEEVGAMAVLDGSRRSATVRASTPARLLRVPGARLLSEAKDGHEHERAIVLRNLLFTQTERVRIGNETRVEALRKLLAEERSRMQLGSFTTHAIALMCVYGLSLRLGIALADEAGDSAPFSVACLVVFVVTLFWMIRRAGEPMATYGFTRRNARPALLRSLGVTAAMCAAATALKTLAILVVPALADAPLFELGFRREGAPLGGLLWVVLYVLFVPVQEFVARGALQGSMRRFLSGRHVGLKANLLANLMFSGSHIHVSTTFALLVIPPGLAWGYLMERDGTLLGPIASHLLTGLWVVFALGVPGLSV